MTFGLELVGTAVIYVGLDGVIPPGATRLYVAIFHAVSAFCNAGFSTFGDSVAGLTDKPLVMAERGCKP